MKPSAQPFADLMREKREAGVTDIHSIALTERQEREAVELAKRLLLESAS